MSTTTEFWFDPVLQFANAKDVEEAVGTLDDTVIVTTDENNKRWQLQFPYDEDRGSLDVVAQEQATLRKMLETLAKRGPTPALWRDVAKETVFVSLRGTAAFGHEPRNFKAIVMARPANLAQWCGFALAELISQGYGDRVKRCALDTCDRFFVDEKAKGPPRLFCSTSHASQARVKRKRQRDARR